jgi:hypothetical protein
MAGPVEKRHDSLGFWTARDDDDDQQQQPLATPAVKGKSLEPRNEDANWLA